MKVDQNGNVSTFVDRMLQAPITDIEFNPTDGLICVSHRGTISTVDSHGIVKDIITGLPIPGIAVHHNNQIAFSDDGKKLYVGIGSVTNNGVTSPNLKDLGMKNNPDMHDIPAKDITLTGQNFESDNPLTPDLTDNATTGAFVGEIGNMAPITHPPESVVPAGHPEKVGGKVIAVDPETGNFTDFVSLNTNNINFRPVGIAFNDDENSLYIASISKFHIRMMAPNGAPLPEPTPWGYPFTGVIWKVTHTGTTTAAEEGGQEGLLINQTTYFWCQRYRKSIFSSEQYHWSEPDRE